MTPRRSVILLALASSAALWAQTTPPPRLLAWSETAGPALFNGLQEQGVGAACPPASILCRSLLGGPLAFAGGTAFDPRHDSAWISNGTVVHEIELATCAVRCQFPAQLMNSSAVVSGLAVLDGGRRLLQMETAPGYMGLRSYDATVCPPVPLRDGCSVTLATGAVAGGLEFDAHRRLVFCSVSTPTAIDWQSEILVARDADRCTFVCRVTLARCGPFYPGAGMVTGLAYDACNQRLFATNGRHTQALDVRDPLRCDMTQVWCCPTGSTWDYKGLAFAPESSVRGVGTGCAARPCLPCAPRTELSGGVPMLGNLDFAVGVASAEVGATAVLLLGAGPCTSGVQLPFLCGPLLPGLVPLPYASPPALVAGSGTCQGTARLGLPIPLARNLCGASLCAQWLVACPAAVAMLGLSDALQFVLRG